MFGEELLIYCIVRYLFVILTVSLFVSMAELCF